MFIFLFSNCKAQDITYFNDEPSKNDLIIIATTIGNYNNLITFTEKYEDDFVSVRAESDSLYIGKVRTDESLGSARGVMFNRKLESINVKINGKELKVKNIPNYRFISIYKKDDEYNLEKNQLISLRILRRITTGNV